MYIIPVRGRILHEKDPQLTLVVCRMLYEKDPQLPTNCLSVFDHFVKLALKGFKKKHMQRLYEHSLL